MTVSMMSSEGFAGDPMHEGGSTPLASLKGGMCPPNTQQPMMSEAMTNPRSAAPDNMGQPWDSTSLEPGHPTTGPNDGARAH
jgi:hypothetical protein